jgi:DNA-directed RNA polymerase subunit K/omega
MIPRDERKTTPYMTKYERARVLGTRALQIRYAYAPTQDEESVKKLLINVIA